MSILGECPRTLASASQKPEGAEAGGTKKAQRPKGAEAVNRFENPQGTLKGLETFRSFSRNKVDIHENTDMFN